MGAGYESVEDVASKVDWEGGVTEAILGYGLKSSDLPETVPPHVLAAWKFIENVDDAVNVVQEWLDTADFSGYAEDDL